MLPLIPFKRRTEAIFRGFMKNVGTLFTTILRRGSHVQSLRLLNCVSSRPLNNILSPLMNTESRFMEIDYPSPSSSPIPRVSYTACLLLPQFLSFFSFLCNYFRSGNFSSLWERGGGELTSSCFDTYLPVSIALTVIPSFSAAAAAFGGRTSRCLTRHSSVVHALSEICHNYIT